MNFAGPTSYPKLLILAICAGATNVSFTWGITIGDVVRVTLLFYMMPVWSMGIAWLLLGERPTRLSLLRLMMALAGVLLVLYEPGNGLPLPRSLADFLALAGGVFFALTNALVRRWRETPEDGRALSMFLGGLVVASVIAVVAANDSVTVFQWHWMPWLIGLSIAFTIGNLGLQFGAARLPAHATALIMLSEIVIAALSSSLLGASHPSAHVWLGGTLIMLAAALAVRRAS